MGWRRMGWNLTVVRNQGLRWCGTNSGVAAAYSWRGRRLGGPLTCPQPHLPHRSLWGVQLRYVPTGFQFGKGPLLERTSAAAAAADIAAADIPEPFQQDLRYTHLFQPISFCDFARTQLHVCR
ncbi:hypothetical protein CLOM_g2737 [Closterium sp. NIES-68]|nr:hypothetical protein CLOM_g2737 [Closterium sp. NIES-68]